jgi:hypothetical protein
MPMPQYAQPLPYGTVPGAGLPLAATGPVVVTPEMAQAYAAQQMQMLPQGAQQAQLGAAKPPSKIGTIIKNMLGFGALGAGVGAVAGLVLPFGPLLGAAVGGAAGALLGLIKGITSKSPEQMPLQPAPDPASMAPIAVGPPAPVKVKKTTRKKHAKPRTYTVKAGDTLSKIGAAHHVSWHSIYAANKKTVGKNPGVLKVGQKLHIPKTSTKKD